MMMMTMTMQEKQEERRDVSLTEIQRQVTKLHDELEQEREKNAVKLHQVVTWHLTLRLLSSRLSDLFFYQYQPALFTNVCTTGMLNFL